MKSRPVIDKVYPFGQAREAHEHFARGAFGKWLELPNGLEVGGSGLSATLRDYGRFGLFLLDDPLAGVVIVVWGALPKPKGMAPIKDDDLFAAVVEALER